MCPKDLQRVRRSTSRCVEKCDQKFKKLLRLPRRSPSRELIEKYNLIEFL